MINFVYWIDIIINQVIESHHFQKQLRHFTEPIWMCVLVLESSHKNWGKILASWPPLMWPGKEEHRVYCLLCIFI